MINAMTVLSLSARAYSSSALAAADSNRQQRKSESENDIQKPSENFNNMGDKDIWISNFKATQALMQSKNFNSSQICIDNYKDKI